MMHEKLGGLQFSAGVKTQVKAYSGLQEKRRQSTAMPICCEIMGDARTVYIGTVVKSPMSTRGTYFFNLPLEGMLIGGVRVVEGGAY